MADVTKFLSLAGLQSYDSKIKAYIGTAVQGKLVFQLVDSLPQTGVENVIYLVPNNGEGNNVKDEYMWINNAWELIGTTACDLSGYYTSTQVDNLLNGKADKATTLAGYGIADAYTKTEVDNKLVGKADASSVYTKEDANKTFETIANVEALEVVVNGKANAATTLAGYGITDAYTKTAVDGLVASAEANAIAAFAAIEESEIAALFN